MKVLLLSISLLLSPLALWASAGGPAGDMPHAQNAMCLVSGQDVTSMGGLIPVTHGGKVYSLCCKGCVRAFNKNPQKYVDKFENS